MGNIYEIKEEQERVILVGIHINEYDDTEASLKELKELVKTAGGSCLATIIQNREAVHPGTYLGKGKIDELREMAASLHATGIVCA